jgi:two-component system OmpR family sensor kinase
MHLLGQRLRRATGSLRSRLVVVVLLLTSLGLLLAATAGTLLLREHLVAQVDDQLAGASRFLTGAPPPPAPDSSQRGALPSPFVLTTIDDSGTVLTQRRGTQASSAPTPDLSGLTTTEIAALGGQPFDVAGEGDAAYSYRAVAVPSAGGSGTTVLAISTEAIDETTGRAALAALAVGVLVLGLVGLLAGGVVEVGLRPLTEVERTAGRIADGDLSQRVPDMPEGTEIGRLATALNGMLAQIETAFDERSASEDQLRRFVADASHELRTPLTTIRGYAELARSGALGVDPVARSTAIGRIEQEALRMGVLVDDLLLLARLDQHRPLARDEVDLVELARGAADALRAAAPDRRVTLAAPDSAVVLGDAGRLRQVLDNLMANARLHTTPGSPVSVGVAASDGLVQVVVADAGPGMTDAEVAHAFERFYRGDPSRTRASGGGSGLGLAIAQAVVQEHGGRLTLVSTPERGTVATVELPFPSRAPAAGRAARELHHAAR